MKRKVLNIAIWTIGMALVAAAPFSLAAECASATVNGTLILPDGSEHAGGILTLCATREYSPVATLHETYVNGMATSMLLSRRGVSEGAPEVNPFMMFTRDDEGRLHLYGYAVPWQGRQVTYLLGQQPGRKRLAAAVITQKNRRTETGTVLLTANVR